MTAAELALVVASALLHGSWNVIAKRQASPFAFLFLMTVATTTAGLPLAWWVPWHSLPIDLVGLIVASGIAHGVTFIALGLAYQRGDLSLVYPISRATPALVPVVAYLWFGERISRVGGLGIGLAVLGLWLIHANAAFRWRALREPAAAFAYLVLCGGVAYSVIDKQAMVAFEAVPWPIPVSPAIAFYFCFTAGACLMFAPVALVGLGARSLWANWTGGWTTITGSAIATLVSYVLILEALRTAPVSYVVAVRQLGVVLVLLVSIHGLREQPGRLRVVGAMATVLGVALIAFGT